MFVLQSAGEKCEFENQTTDFKIALTTLNCRFPFVTYNRNIKWPVVGSEGRFKWHLAFQLTEGHFKEAVTKLALKAKRVNI